MPKSLVKKKLQKLPPRKKLKPKVKSQKPALDYIRIRVDNGCPKCGGVMEYSACASLGRLKGGGYFECLKCRLYSNNVTIPVVLKVLQELENG